MRKLTNIDTKAKHAINIRMRFLSDGTIVLKKGSTTIQKNGSSAFVEGGMTKEFFDDVVENINLVQKSFTSWILELRGSSKFGISACYPGEELPITSIKYARVVTTIVEDSLPSKASNPSSELVSANPSSELVSANEETKDSEEPLSESVSNESKVYGQVALGSASVGSKRYYSTKAIVPYQKENIVPQPAGIVPFHRVPSLIKMVRSPNGSFKFDGLDLVNLLHSRGLKDVLDSIKGKMRELESINDKGYINSTRLSDYPVLSGYLKPYVKSKKLDKLEIDELESMGEQGILNLLDKGLTLREKRVLVV